MPTPRSVVVVGAGVAGLCCAYHLRKQDFSVTVVESNRIGSGASWANGGWLCPAQAGPVPEPGLTIYGIRSLFDRNSALYFDPRTSLALLPWLLRFWTYCNARDYRRGTEAIAVLGRDVFALIEELVHEGVQFELQKTGMLVAARDVGLVRGALQKLMPMRDYGYELPSDVVSGDELHELEPALAPAVSAGFLVQQHWYVRPESFTSGLAAALRSEGVEILEGAEVVDFAANGHTLNSVVTRTSRYSADVFVLAAGAWTSSLARMLGIRFPLQGGKGYSFFVTPSIVPRRPVLLADVHVGCTPFGEQMRIGGTMEFSGLNSRLDHRRIETIVRGAEASFLPWNSRDAETEWAGLRPMTPDGLPILDGGVRYRNVFVATGYAMQGMTVALPAGRALATFITSGRRPPTLEPFRLDRFRSLRLPARQAMRRS